MEMLYDVFISYSRLNMDLADRIEATLKKKGLRCFIDRETIEVGEDFAEKIGMSIHNSEIVLFLWTKESNQSANVAREVALASDYGKTIVPFRIGDFISHYRLAYYLALANRADKNQGFSENDLEKLTDRVLKSVDGARAKRIENEEKQFVKLEEDNNSGQIVSNEKKKINIRECISELQIEKEDKSSQHQRLNVQSTEEDQFEWAYSLGCEMFKKYKLDEAFELLIEPALADYKNARTYLQYCIETPIRCCKIQKHRFTELASQEKNLENPFALYLLGVYYMNIDRDYNKSYQYAVRSMEKGSDYGKMLYIKCHEFGVGVEKDFEKILPRLRKLAMEGNPMALYRYGSNLIYGWSCEKQPDLGLKFILNGANQGDIRCLNFLAGCYLDGDVVDQDLDKAEDIFTKLIERGWVEAYQNLGRLYAFNPDGSSKDIKKGFTYFSKGAELNEPGCMEWLAILYENGLNGKTNITQAIRWYNRAAALGSRYSYEYLGNLYYYGFEGADIVDKTKAWEYFKKGAEQYSSWNSYYMMSQMYYDGYAPEEVTELDAIKYMEECIFGAGSNAGKAACKLYEIYHNGKVVPPDEQKGIYFLQKAAEYEHEEALVKIGEVLTTNLNSPYADEIKGIKYLSKAYEMGNVDAAIMLAELYRSGLATIRDIEKSKEYLQFAIDKEESPKALLEMGKLFAHVQQPGWDEDFEDEEVSEEQKAAEQKIAIEYLTRAGELKQSEAYPSLVSLGLELVFGDHISEEEENELRNKIFDWAKTGAELDNHQSHLDLGVFYQMGFATDENLELAEKSYLRSSELGNAAAPATLARLYDDFYKQYSNKISDAYYYAFLSKTRGHESDCFTTLDEHCKTRALEIEQCEEGFDEVAFMNLTLPRKLNFLPSESPLISDIQDNTSIVNTIKDMIDVCYLSYPTADTKITSFIDMMRLYCANLWGELKSKYQILSDVSFFDHEKIREIIENESDEYIKKTLSSIPLYYFNLQDLYEKLNNL